MNVLDIPTSIGRYEILERVARGGMGALYRARDPVLEREVAIKVMLADFSHDANGRTRFYREARAIARLQHRNIVTLFDYGEDEGNPFIVMEFLQGQTLAARVKHGPPVPLAQALATGAQLCTGLHFAHGSGIVHRDVKPANIWLEDDGGVKLLDFGIAKFGDTDVTQAGDVLGSISYMSPEQLAGGTIDGRSDIFSAGIVMYELLTGRRPFQGESPTAIMMKIIHEEAPPLDEVPGAPPKLRGMIGKALEKNPERRYQRAAEFASELRDLQLSIERQQENVRGTQTDTIRRTVPVAPVAHRGAARVAATWHRRVGGAPVRRGPAEARRGRRASRGVQPPTVRSGWRVPGAMLSSGEMVTATHTPGPQALRAPVAAAQAPISADALLMRSRRRDRRLRRSAERRDDWRPRGFRHRRQSRASGADRLATRVGARQRRRGDHRRGRRGLPPDARRSDGSHRRRTGVRCRVVFVRQPSNPAGSRRSANRAVGGRVRRESGNRRDSRAAGIPGRRFDALPGHREGWRSASAPRIAPTPILAVVRGAGAGVGSAADTRRRHHPPRRRCT